jgi:Rieske 2Fe-2S family protein
MLPAAAYVADDVFAWEQRHLFAGSWFCVGRAADLTAQQALAAGDVSVVVTVADGRARAFANVCSHRGHELLTTGACTDRSAMVCPYHGWAYTVDGRLRTAPRMGGGFDKARFGLVELPVAQWHGWVFVNATGEAMDFVEHVGTLDRLVAPYEPGRLVVKARHDYTVRANWKIIAENYHECYHCPMIHPELCAVTPPTSGENWHEPGQWLGGSMQLRDHAETMSLDGRSYATRLPGADARTVRYLGLFPNLLISAHPDYVLTHRLLPSSAGETRVECEWLFDPAVTDPSFAVGFWDLTNRQDWDVCELAQKGAGSRGYTPGRYSLEESDTHAFDRMVAERYMEALRDREPVSA